MAAEPNLPIIDAWANAPFADMAVHLPEIHRLFYYKFLQSLNQKTLQN